MVLITEPHRYTQCELMSVHYKHPLLLVEFEEHKSFSLEVSLACVRKGISLHNPLRFMLPRQGLTQRGKESSRRSFPPRSPSTLQRFRRRLRC
jgi:hypothetical protein